MTEAKAGSGPVASVRRRILVPFALVLSCVVIAFVIAAYVFQQRLQRDEIEASVAAVQQLFRLQVDKDAAMMHAAVKAMMNDPMLRDAMRRGDRDHLLSRVRPLYQQLRDDNHVTHLYFTLPDRVNLLRVHEPERSGDIIDRVTMLDAAANGLAGARGLELGLLGTLTLRTVLPWRDGETLLGFVELGEDISQMADEIHRILGLDLVVLVRKELIERRRWEEGLRVLGRSGKWDQLASAVVLAQTAPSLPPELVSFLDRDDRPDKLAVGTGAGRRELYAAWLPLADVAGRTLGEILVLRDVTAIQRDFRHSITVIAVASALAGGLVFMLFVAVLEGVDRTYRRKNEIEMQFLRLSSEHERIIQIEKLSEVGKTVGEIAHQLNSPLVGVINLAQLAERTADDVDRTRSLLSEIRKAGEDCRDFVRRMLEFTRLSRSERRSVRLQEIVSETVLLFQQSAGPRPVAIALPEAPVVLELDPVLLRHALFNLLVNAAQAAPADAPIDVRLRPERRKGRDGWTISVLDRGPGVADQDKERIFVPFYSTRADGTGLGLPVARHIALLHGGGVGVADRSGGGAHFSLWLPVPDDLSPDRAGPGQGGAPS